MCPTMRFPPTPSSVGTARQFIRKNLAGLPDDTVEAAVLMTSELVTNAVVHGRTRGEVSVKVGEGSLRVAVRDESKRLPVEESQCQLDEHSRGLVIVSELSDRWGVVENLVGKSVWFTLGSDAV